MFRKIVSAVIVCVFLYTQIHADKINDALNNQKVKLLKICTDAGFKFSCILDSTCVPSCADNSQDVENNNCRYINESIYDNEMVEFFQCGLFSHYSDDNFAQCEAGFCSRVF